jgi:hypothetical protein
MLRSPEDEDAAAVEDRKQGVKPRPEKELEKPAVRLEDSG